MSATGRLSHTLLVMLLGREEGPPFWDRMEVGQRNQMMGVQLPHAWLSC